MSGQTNTVWNCHYYEPPSRILSEGFENMFHLGPITLVLVLPSLLFIVKAPRRRCPRLGGCLAWYGWFCSCSWQYAAGLSYGGSKTTGHLPLL